MIENNVQIRYSNMNFTGKVPVKNKYSKIKKYYQSIGDQANAKYYKSMENKAKARMHLKKSVDIQNQILDFSEQNSEEILNKRETLKSYAKMAKLFATSIYENILGMFYSMKK